MRAFAQAPSAESTTRGNGSTFSFGAFAAMLVCAAAFLGIGAPAASAAPEAQPGWSYQSSFGNVNTGTFDLAHSSLAVDSSGNVFGSIQENGGANGYRPDGTFLGQYDLSGLVRNIAADLSDDTLYVDDIFGGPSISRWISDGEPTPAYTVDPGFSVPAGASLAVDATTSDILVTDPAAEAIRRYDTTGALVATIATPSLSPTWIVTSPDGSFYVASDGGPDVIHLSATGTPLGTIAAVGSLQGLAFDPVHEVLIATVSGTLKTYTAAGALLSERPGSSSAAGLASGESGRLYEFAGRTINAYTFAIFPGVEAPVVSEVEARSADVSAEVDPGAGPPEGSVAHFEYSVDGGTSWASTTDESVERTGTEGPDTIEAHLTGLVLNSDYLVRVKASNSLASSVSAVAAFSTPEIAPEVETGPSSDRSQTSATLNGTVNPAGLQTTYHFEYGTTTSYGSRVPLATEAPAGNLRAPREVSRLISGLQPGTTYHYRLVAENAIGVSLGVDRTFTTLVPAEVFPQRAYEQVTPVDKGGAALNSDWNVQSAADGSAIAVGAVAAAKDSESALLLQNYLSRRGSGNWLDWEQLDPPQDGAPGINESVTAGLSADYKHALVVSNRALAPGANAGGFNLYVKDLVSGNYTFVGGAAGAGAYEGSVVIQSSKRIFINSAPDMSWVVFQAKPSLMPGVAPRNIYRWSEEDGLEVVSVFPGGFSPTAALSWGGLKSFKTVSSDGRSVAYGFDFGGANFGPIFHREDSDEPTPVSASQRSENLGELDVGYLEGMTPDGRYVFFTSSSRLTEDTPEKSSANDFLYRFDADSGDLGFISRVRSNTAGAVFGFSDDGKTVYFEAVKLVEGDTFASVRVWHEGETESETHFVSGDSITANQGAFVSPDGRYMAWVAPAPYSVEFPNQAQLYDAVADETVCVSCPVAGKPAGSARFMSPAPNIGNETPRVVSTDGTMFFDTPTRLLAADHNGTRDVYGYQDGRLTLISPGDEDFGAFFVDASADGSNVFFQTNQGIVGQDTDGNADIYDARVGGGFASQNPPPPPGSCQGAECAQAGGPAAAGPPTATGANLPDRQGQQAGKVTIKSVKIGARVARVTVRATQAGKVNIAGGAVRATGRRLSKPGTYTVAVPLSASARAKRSEGAKLQVTLKVRLSGSWGTAVAKYSKTLGK